jgi:DNA-binding transcriptional MerR regulator
MKMPTATDYVTSKEAADILGISTETLRFWRYSGKHSQSMPAYMHISRRIFYKRDDVHNFVETEMFVAA